MTYVPTFEFYDDGLVHSHDWSRSTPPGGHHGEFRRSPPPGRGGCDAEEGQARELRR